MAFLFLLPVLAQAQESLTAERTILDTTFYPSALNTTAWYANYSSAWYNESIYQSGTYQPADNIVYPSDSSAGDLPYGTYDYCFEPHPRSDVYSKPAPVENGSVNAELVYLQYVQRHQRRTSYNVLPGGENEPWDCDNVDAYLYAAPSNQWEQQPVRVYGQTYTTPTNPFGAHYVPSTCQLPQLTIGGVLDGYTHGQDLWSVYGEKLGFLPWQPDQRTWFRSSESALTQQSAGAVIRGLWPWYQGSVPLHQQPAAIDTTNESFDCPRRGTVLSAIEATPEWQAHLAAAAPLFNNLTWATNGGGSGWVTSFNNLADNFQSRLCNGYKLPCNVNDTSQCVTYDQAQEVLRGGDWEWNYWYRTNSQAQLYIQTVEGPFLSEILSRFEAVKNGTSPIIYEHDFLHDNDVGPIAGALGISALRWPGMASNIAFELWKVTNSGDIFARVLYSGQPMETIYGTLDWIPLQQLIDILQPYAPSNIVAICNS